MEAFCSANSWTDEYLPAASWRTPEKPDAAKGRAGRVAESLLNKLAPERLNRILFRITTRRWQLKRSNQEKNIKGMTLDLITGLHTARSNPGSFQEKVLEQYKQKVRDAESAFLRSTEPVRICAAAKG